MDGPDTSFRVFGWNLGGVDVSDLPKAIQDGTDRCLRKRDVVLVQEYPRVKEGWHTELLGGFQAVTFRRKGTWRGTGVVFDTSVWSVISRRYTGRGVWIHPQAP